MQTKKGNPGRREKKYRPVTITIPLGLLGALDMEAKQAHRSRSGQVCFFLDRAVVTVATSEKVK